VLVIIDRENINEREMMNTLMEDLREPLDKVERAWIRKPVTVFLYGFLVALLIIPGMMVGIWFMVSVEAKDFFIKGWKGTRTNIAFQPYIDPRRK